MAALMVTSVAFAQTWTLDKAHGKLGFTAEHMMISDVEGWFRNFDAKFTASKEDFTDAVIELSADVNSINTENEKRDGHLRSPDFFDVAKYPTLTFKSKSFKKLNAKEYKLVGDLTMHGVTRQVELNAILRGVTAVPNSTKKIAGFKVTGALKRSDFGIAASMPTGVVSDEINLIANAEFIQTPAATLQPTE